MDEQEKKRHIASLKEAQKTGFKSPLDDNPDLNRELYIGQLRRIKAHLNRIKRKGIQGQELDFELDQYNKQRKKILEDIKREGFQYTKGEEDDDKYKKYGI